MPSSKRKDLAKAKAVSLLFAEDENIRKPKFNNFSGKSALPLHGCHGVYVTLPGVSISPTRRVEKSILARQLIRDWSVSQVQSWIRSLNMSKDYTELVGASHIIGAVLLTMTSMDWRQLGVRNNVDLALLDLRINELITKDKEMFKVQQTQKEHFARSKEGVDSAVLYSRWGSGPGAADYFSVRVQESVAAAAAEKQRRFSEQTRPASAPPSSNIRTKQDYSWQHSSTPDFKRTSPISFNLDVSAFSLEEEDGRRDRGIFVDPNDFPVEKPKPASPSDTPSSPSTQSLSTHSTSPQKSSSSGEETTTTDTEGESEEEEEESEASSNKQLKGKNVKKPPPKSAKKPTRKLNRQDSASSTDATTTDDDDEEEEEEEEEETSESSGENSSSAEESSSNADEESGEEEEESSSARNTDASADALMASTTDASQSDASPRKLRRPDAPKKHRKMRSSSSSSRSSRKSK